MRRSRKPLCRASGTGGSNPPLSVLISGRIRYMPRQREQLRQTQRDAIWKWRWLGLRKSTPGFKGAIVVLIVVAVIVALRAFSVL